MSAVTVISGAPRIGDRREVLDQTIEARLKRLQAEAKGRDAQGIVALAITAFPKRAALAGWLQEQLDDYLAAHDLPRHPLVDDGYPSIGCMPCMRRVKDGESYRDGR